MFGQEVRILIIDDSYTTRVQLRRLLEDLGYQNVTEAKDGEDAIRKLSFAYNAGSPIQLIISDWEMPGRSGLELFKLIRESPQWVDTPFLFMTVHASFNDVFTAAAAGIQHFLVKPIDKDKLKVKIDELYNTVLSKFARTAAEALHQSSKKKSG
jgi:two-component system, chemotaxis family, chemotaxis protein CheY